MKTMKKKKLLIVSEIFFEIESHYGFLPPNSLENSWKIQKEQIKTSQFLKDDFELKYDVKWIKRQKHS
jgi:hypothetical protein